MYQMLTLNYYLSHLAEAKLKLCGHQSGAPLFKNLSFPVTLALGIRSGIKTSPFFFFFFQAVCISLTLALTCCDMYSSSSQSHPPPRPVTSEGFHDAPYEVGTGPPLSIDWAPACRTCSRTRLVLLLMSHLVDAAERFVVKAFLCSLSRACARLCSFQAGK